MKKEHIYFSQNEPKNKKLARRIVRKLDKALKVYKEKQVSILLDADSAVEIHRSYPYAPDKGSWGPSEIYTLFDVKCHVINHKLPKGFEIVVSL